jgi:hypothetical protein
MVVIEAARRETYSLFNLGVGKRLVERRAGSRQGRETNTMGDFLTLRKMITPMLIQVVFWVSVVAAVIAGLVAIGNGETATGVLVIVGGPLVIRIYCELLILFFRMNETLTDLKKASQNGHMNSDVPSVA